MSSATKTLQLLSYFSANQPEIGLSRMSALAKRDKATTYRHLQSLQKVGFVEQNPLTKHYRLGPAILQLAQIREVTVPRKEGAQAALSALANETGETAHVSVLSGTTVFPLLSHESPAHSIRAIIDISSFPLHATASGLCALAFGPTDLFDVAAANMQTFTADTPTCADDLSQAIKTARDTGFGSANRSFEAEIYSVSAPVFDQTGLFAGAVSVASVASRLTPGLNLCIRRALMIASREVTRNWGGAMPDFVEAAWAKSVSQSNALETAQ